MQEFDDSKTKKYQETYPPNKMLFEQGEEGESFYLIKEGKVRVYKENGEEKLHLGSVGPGELLGEMAVIENQDVRSATAVCYTRVRCLEFSENEFDQLASKSKKFRKEVFTLLSERLSEVDERLWEAKKIEDKLYKAAFLLIHLIDEKNWYFQSEENVKLNPSVEALSSFSDIDPPLLKKFLSAPDLSGLLNYSPDVQNKVKSVALDLIEMAMPYINFQVPNYKIEEEVEEVTDESTLKEKIAMSDRLFQVLENKGKDLNKEEFRKIYDRYKTLREKLQELKESGEKSEYSIKRLEANIDSIRRQINDINPADLKTNDI